MIEQGERFQQGLYKEDGQRCRRWWWRDYGGETAKKGRRRKAMKKFVHCCLDLNQSVENDTFFGS